MSMTHVLFVLVPRSPGEEAEFAVERSHVISGMGTLARGGHLELGAGMKAMICVIYAVAVLQVSLRDVPQSHRKGHISLVKKRKETTAAADL